ncbi:uncharacterized protein Z520_03890 [Fonsecaea multimorphosa CBS 102226]|uniref:Protein kinase domain-containing protein n=1 Tax=Fonsecaea multimorphosa CBS 102226 TaxID=1442371 RepID=A0A0D2KAL3_9EURO|nr:uncharacterized protein Z520_03890 [Fonsecaea multimorphosa CBS 102226]KIY00205.1 hypothetical protein Z520_03890 [Fonsecaea multimorphosa CBS 102226]OAL27400.1 hypothetical protein AYO22_03675 [Fonsecaea multimorphosa]
MNARCSAFQRRVNEIRVENSDGRKFVPEKEYFELLSRKTVEDIIRGDLPVYHLDEVVDFVIKDARKVFGILALIGAITHLDQFIRKDQYRNRPTDDLLPFAKDTLKGVLQDAYYVELFFEKQWEFCVPVISGRIMPRLLELHTILPYLEDTVMGSGSSGSVSMIKIHPSHQPQSFEGTTNFVRKEYDFDDTTYDNEIRVLSTLQLLKNPNILQLVGCYTYKSKHNLISPYVTGGTLRTYLANPKPEGLSQERILCSLSGLACGLWALHELVLDNNEPSHKGHHQDLSLDNVLVEGDRFILADFGLSSIRNIKESSLTPFKGRRDYCQAPECVDLRRPYQERDTTRATDIFSLGCIAADVLVYLVKGPSGVKEFRDARAFTMPPMCYFLYHNGDAPNTAVSTWLQGIAQESGSQSIQDVVQLITEMLEISPQSRPSASMVMARLCVSTIKAYSERFSTLFSKLASSPGATIEEARFVSWQHCQDLELYSDSLGATQTGEYFHSTVQILRQFHRSLENIRTGNSTSSSQPFLEVSILNTQLLNHLSPKRRSSAGSWLESIVLSKLPSNPQQPAPVLEMLKPSLGDSRISRLAEIRHRVAELEDTSSPSADVSTYFLHDPITYTGNIGQYTSAIVTDKVSGQDRPVVVESVHYQDVYRRRHLEFRIDGLCRLLTDQHLAPQLRVLPFVGIYDNKANFCFDLVYGYPTQHQEDLAQLRPISLHELLEKHEILERPPWESRVQLSLELTESLVAFHDVNWYHKDLTPFNVLFFHNRVGPVAPRVHQLYLIGFQHSHNAADDLTEGPLQDRRHQRYHHPQYIDVQDHNFKRFRPHFDWYSLGILLVEVGFWSPIDKIMSRFDKVDNQTFSNVLLQQKVPELSFLMGSAYANVVRACLTGVQSSRDMDTQKGSKSPISLLLKERVVAPLKEFCVSHIREVGRKRRREEDD